MNPRSGGHVISVTSPPSSNPSASLEAEYNVRPLPGALYYNTIKDVKDGIYLHVHGKTPNGDVAFDCYHLKQEVYEQAAREGGLAAELSWG